MLTLFFARQRGEGQLGKLLGTLVRIILSPPRVFLSGCGKARFAGNSGAIAKQRNAAAAAQEQPNVKIILTRVLRHRCSLQAA